MRAPISVVIPVLNAGNALSSCAASLMEGVEAGLIRELIVSDGGSHDATQQIADEIGGVWVSGGSSRGGQLQRGCKVAQGEWLLVLHADTQLEAGWSDAAAAHLGRANAGYFKLQFAKGGLPARIVARWANMRSRLFGLPYGDQGLLISRALYDSVGGYRDIPLMEDVALVRVLKGRLTRLDARAVTSADKYERSGWLKRGGRNLWTLIRYFSGVPVETLAAAYRKA
ncbi:TIGR04283 family arsenosugar biosynthesis glycosyltransferase [Planktotalea sp.]|uniref:TIGR04283 family arsenosugar biosynthesis glycosyltransferase n=1 Tax=Planktotalea sp. TaxID=2029877 RepID=UPI0025DA168A|nr:TIGR04283 family arsenosugar biosynthesis glycosyltransferase [Planktotalea sp.]